MLYFKLCVCGWAVVLNNSEMLSRQRLDEGNIDPSLCAYSLLVKVSQSLVGKLQNYFMQEMHRTT